jgi:hypothetical protein
MPARKGTRPPGRQKGTPNKATQSAREIFAAFLDYNAPRAQAWIDRVAIRNPAKALDTLVKLAEFFLPKLARTEVVGKDGAPLAGRTAPITDPIEAARIYQQIMGDTSIDLGSLKFESPRVPLAELQAIIEEMPMPPAEPSAEPSVADPNLPPAEPRASNAVDMSLWEKLAK